MNEENKAKDESEKKEENAHTVGDLYKLTKEMLQSQLIARGLPKDFAQGPNTDILAKALVRDTLQEMKIIPKKEEP